MTILSNPSRIGRFTSSKIHNLMKRDRSGKGFGAPALTYIEETNMARRLGRSLTNETNSRETSWGKCLEPIAFDKLGFDYELVSNVTLTHPDIPYWCGSPDLIKPGTVGDIKCPMTLKSFCQLIDHALLDNTGQVADQIKKIRADHPSGEAYYWQLVSNAILTNSQFAELIVYVPYRADLPIIRLTALDNDDYKWIGYADDYELPWLNEGGHYHDINTIRFEVPQSDKELLTDTVLEAGKRLIQ